MSSAFKNRRYAAILAGLAALLLLAADEPGEDAVPGSDTVGASVHLIPVPLPIVGNVDQRVKQAIDTALKSSPDARPLLVLEFRGDEETRGAGSEFERSLSLARYLAGLNLRRAHTVAFLPHSVNGHAVLPALACEEIVIGREAEFGAAGLGEESVDEAMIGAYREIARRRRTVPELVVLAMLSKELAAYKAETIDGVRYVDAKGLEQLRKTTTIRREKTIVREGDLARLVGEDMRVEYGFASHTASDRKQLAFALKLPVDALREDVSNDGDWTAIRVELRGRIHEKNVRDVQRRISDRIRRGDVNLVCLLIDSPGGSPADSTALANYLADIPTDQIRTVAYVPRQARADAALPALACDQLVVGDPIVLGGPGDHQPSEQERTDMVEPVQRIAKAKSRDWSLMLGLVDYQRTLHRYLLDGNGEPRILTAEEHASLADTERWEQAEELDLSRGLSTAEARQYGLAADVATSPEELLQVLHVSGFEDVKPSPVVDAIERLAAQPWLARTLLFIAFFAFISEASAPGFGAPGFVSLVCFLLFFWIQFFNGAADWLEVILFVGGFCCLAMELLVIPGFGVFGIGGVLMVLSSVLLATQTFVLPRNRYQYDQLPGSLFSVIVAMTGTLAAVWLMRAVLPHAPYFNRLMLRTLPSKEIERREALVNFEHLMNKAGTAATQLTPSGKATFGDEVIDVISRGEVIAAGARVVVSEVHGNRIVVESVDSLA